MKVLPKSIFREDYAREEQERWDKRQRSFQKEVALLSELMNITFEKVEQLEAVNVEWLKEQIERSQKNLKSVLGAGSFIPSGISKQFNDNYDDIRRRAVDPVNDIASTMEFLKGQSVKVKIDSKGRPWFDEKDVKAKVTAYATYMFSVPQREAFPYVQAISDALNAWRKFEKDKGYQQGNVLSLMNNINLTNKQDGKDNFDISADEFFNFIAYGRILRIVDKPEPEED